MKQKDRRTRHKEELRQAILDAAGELFVTEGYQNTSIRKIAQKIDYSPTAIYFYFRDKADLLDSLCAETFTNLDAECQRIQATETDHVEGLRKGLRGYVEFGLKHRNHYMATFLIEVEPIDPKQTTRKWMTGMKAFNNMRQMVARFLHAEGQQDPKVIEECSQALWAGVHGVTTLLINDTNFPFVEHDRLIDRLIDVLVAGLHKQV